MFSWFSIFDPVFIFLRFHIPINNFDLFRAFHISEFSVFFMFVKIFIFSVMVIFSFTNVLHFILTFDDFIFCFQVGELTFSWHQNTNCCRAIVVCLDARGLRKPGQNCISYGFTLSLPSSALCETGKTTIDTGCDPALPRNCVDHPAHCNLFKNITLLYSQ